MIFNPPNVLTAFRLVAGPLGALFLWWGLTASTDEQLVTWWSYALALFVAGAVTDWIDGWLARRLGQVTAFGALLSQGIGDTIRVSLSAPPVEEVKVGIQILQALNLRERKLEIVSCPSCGRAQVDVYELAEKVTAGLEGMEVPLRVAVMGCVVNGPGEAREADLGVASGNGKGQIFVKGEVIKTVPESQIVETLIDEAMRIAETMEPEEGASPQVVATS
ncbi:flavodoxin-dependent (E)-4-hydroxy-3-methylbut-2-enyl-diphosphate synthase [uncultured Demequina sp.]|uniref:flavodoxin-dependent (E)-4-hydroxy-3-methylbut-2-enyl-diphosphate synthase n=1 Tax=uncultured Demequina sp. TaxID=693499 RepID=UPI0025FBC6A3|nr:flavodoxin-dependent (E)-4-hydroxy-3-methylbut-2-enyl-diphosphate synthase [uncultured Demequina sp.]